MNWNNNRKGKSAALIARWTIHSYGCLNRDSLMLLKRLALQRWNGWNSIEFSRINVFIAAWKNVLEIRIKYRKKGIDKLPWLQNCLLITQFQVYLATRSGSWVMNRVWDKGEPTDLVYLNRYLFLFFHFFDFWPTISGRVKDEKNSLLF